MTTQSAARAILHASDKPTPQMSSAAAEFVWPECVPSASASLSKEEWREKYLLAQEQLDFICQRMDLPPGNIGFLAAEAYDEAVERADRHAAEACPTWHPRIGEPVEVTEHLIARFEEWAGVPLWIVGIEQEVGANGQNVSVTDKWLLCRASRPYTDGFYINRNGVPDDLRPRDAGQGEKAA